MAPTRSSLLEAKISYKLKEEITIVMFSIGQLVHFVLGLLLKELWHEMRNRMFRLNVPTQELEATALE